MGVKHRDEVEVISYSPVCEAVDQCLNSLKIPKDLKREAQKVSCTVWSTVKEEDKREMSAVWMLSPFLSR